MATRGRALGGELSICCVPHQRAATLALALTAAALALADAALRATLWPGLCWLLALGLYGQ